MAAGFKTVEPLEYYRRFLKENCRPDGRELGEFRTTTVNVGSITTADGSALVKLGNTTVICGIKAEFAEPPAESNNKGYIVPNVDLPPLCSSRFRPGPPGEEAQAASQFIADVIENSEIIMKEDLCIAHGKELTVFLKHWILHFLKTIRPVTGAWRSLVSQCRVGAPHYMVIRIPCQVKQLRSEDSRLLAGPSNQAVRRPWGGAGQWKAWTLWEGRANAQSVASEPPGWGKQ
nr:exosome complex component RRP43 isoform X3 [Chelonoidis abingdonii]